MSNSYARLLTFRTNDLGTDATILLTFDQYVDGLYNDQFPVAWKVFRFGSTGPYHASVGYKNQLAICKPQVDYASDTVVDSGTFQPLNYGQQTTLTKDDNGVYMFTPPEALTGADYLKVYNGTQLREDIGLGFLPTGGWAPTPVRFWRGVGAGSSIQTQFSPVLRAYITSQYQETQIIRGEVNSPYIFEQNLAQLDDSTVWDLTYDPAAGRFSITRQ